MELPIHDIPDGVEIVDTGFDESQKQLREIDRQKRIDDPEYRGAFHEKKQKFSSKDKKYVDKFAPTRTRQKRKKR